MWTKESQQREPLVEKAVRAAKKEGVDVTAFLKTEARIRGEKR